MIDEYTRECLAIRVARRLGRYEVIEALADVMGLRGVPESISLGQRTGVRSERFCGSGWRKLEREHSTLSQEVPGRTATVKASTGSCGMNA